MLSAKFFTKIAVFGLFIGTLQSFPQDINFGGRQIGFGGQDDDRLDTKSGNFYFLLSLCVTEKYYYWKCLAVSDNNIKSTYLGSGSGQREDQEFDTEDVTERRNGQRDCCCVHVSSRCPNPASASPNTNGGFNNGGSNGGFLSAASPRLGPSNGDVDESDIGSRIVNRVCVF